MTDRFILPARTARAVVVRKDSVLRIVNTYGSQVVDTWAFCADPIDEFMSMEHSRVHAVSPMPGVGTVFRTNRRRPILEFIADSSSGQHDWFYAACDRQRYALLGFDGVHENCTDNLYNAMSIFGRDVPCVPCPLNLFENAPLLVNGDMEIKPPTSHPGDSVELKAAMDIIVCLSACPQNMVATNGTDMTPKDVEVQILNDSKI